MNGRRIAVVLVALLAAALGIAATASARAVTLKPASFQAQGSLINGWYWLRAASHQATWAFDAGALQQAMPGRVYLNMTGLVTKGVSGGSGYSTSLKVIVSNGIRTQTTSMSLLNPFRPVDPEDSGGVGYYAYGNAYLSSSLWKGAQKLTVTVMPRYWQTYHVAANADSMLIGYSISGTG
jgi:hypothetical protein